MSKPTVVRTPVGLKVWKNGRPVSKAVALRCAGPGEWVVVQRSHWTEVRGRVVYTDRVGGRCCVHGCERVATVSRWGEVYCPEHDMEAAWRMAGVSASAGARTRWSRGTTGAGGALSGTRSRGGQSR